MLRGGARLVVVLLFAGLLSCQRPLSEDWAIASSVHPARLDERSRAERAQDHGADRVGATVGGAPVPASALAPWTQRAGTASRVETKAALTVAVLLGMVLAFRKTGGGSG